jgi:hypothetical protein
MEGSKAAAPYGSTRSPTQAERTNARVSRTAACCFSIMISAHHGDARRFRELSRRPGLPSDVHSGGVERVHPSFDGVDSDGFGYGADEGSPPIDGAFLSGLAEACLVGGEVGERSAVSTQDAGSVCNALLGHLADLGPFPPVDLTCGEHAGCLLPSCFGVGQVPRGLLLPLVAAFSGGKCLGQLGAGDGSDNGVADQLIEGLAGDGEPPASGVSRPSHTGVAGNPVALAVWTL